MSKPAMTIAECRAAVEAGILLGSILITHKVRNMSNYDESDSRAYSLKHLYTFQNTSKADSEVLLATVKARNPHLVEVTGRWYAYNLTP